jgi:hypothetical protein
MEADEKARLRATCAAIGLPLRFEEPDCVASTDDTGAACALGFFVSSHAPLVVDAVNALPRVLDALDVNSAAVASLMRANGSFAVWAAEAVALVERERDDLGSRVKALETALRNLVETWRSRDHAASPPGVPWCKRCGSEWDSEAHGQQCPVGRALLALRATEGAR